MHIIFQLQHLHCNKSTSVQDTAKCGYTTRKQQVTLCQTDVTVSCDQGPKKNKTKNNLPSGCCNAHCLWRETQSFWNKARKWVSRQTDKNKHCQTYPFLMLNEKKQSSMQSTQNVVLPMCIKLKIKSDVSFFLNHTWKHYRILHIVYSVKISSSLDIFFLNVLKNTRQWHG